MINNIIAIDGPSASGKGTLSRKLAQHLDYAHLETGLLYRGVGWLLLQSEGNPEDPIDSLTAVLVLKEALIEDPDFLSNPVLRSNDVADYTSRSSLHPEVRQALFDLQREFALFPPNGKKGAILDGRDIGTIVCPDAPAKLYVVASAEIRAQRRLKELQNMGQTPTYADVLAEVQARDERDQNRPIAPLKPAQDAIILDTTNLTADEVFKRVLEIVSSKLGVKSF